MPSKRMVLRGIQILKIDHLVEKLLSLIFFGDLMSIYLAALNGVDPEDITSINYLKSELAKVS